MLASEAEDEHERTVDGAELVRVETPGGPTEPLRIDDRRLLDEATPLRGCRLAAVGAGAALFSGAALRGPADALDEVGALLAPVLA